MSRYNLTQRVKRASHDLMVDFIAERIVNKGVTNIHTCEEYFEGNRIAGEIDVLGLKGNQIRFYEYKLNPSKKGFEKALEQYKRFKKFYNHQDIKGVYVSGGLSKPLVCKRLDEYL